MTRIVLSRETMEEILWGDHDDYKMVEDKIVDHRRWTVKHTMVFKSEFPGESVRHYRASYSQPATENQYQDRFDEQTTCEEVYPVKVTTIEYKAVT